MASPAFSNPFLRSQRPPAKPKMQATYGGKPRPITKLATGGTVSTQVMAPPIAVGPGTGYYTPQTVTAPGTAGPNAALVAQAEAGGNSGLPAPMAGSLMAANPTIPVTPPRTAPTGPPIPIPSPTPGATTQGVTPQSITLPGRAGGATLPVGSTSGAATTPQTPVGGGGNSTLAPSSALPTYGGPPTTAIPPASSYPAPNALLPYQQAVSTSEAGNSPNIAPQLAQTTELAVAGGQQLQNQFQGFTGSSAAQTAALQQQLASAYAPLLAGQGGYTPQQSADIENLTGQFGLDNLNPAALTTAYNTGAGGVTGAVDTGATNVNQALTAGDTSAAQAFNTGSGNVQGALTSGAGNVNGAFDTGAGNVEGALGTGAGNLDQALATGTSSVNSYLNPANLTYTPQMQQDLITNAANTARTAAQAQQQANSNAAFAAGNVSPMALAAMNDRANQTGELAGADAMTQARLQASQAALGAQQTYAQMGTQNAQQLAALNASSQLAQENTAVGAQQNLTNLGVNSQLAQENAALSAQQNLANLGVTNAQETAQRDTGAQLQQEATGVGAAQNLASLGETTAQAGQTEGMNLNQIESGTATTVANANLQAGQEARNNYLGTQEQQANQNITTGAQQQLGAYSSEISGANSAGQTQVGNKAVNNQSPSSPVNILNAIGAARGAVMKGPRVAEVGEKPDPRSPTGYAPEAIVPLGPPRHMAGGGLVKLGAPKAVPKPHLMAMPRVSSMGRTSYGISPAGLPRTMTRSGYQRILPQYGGGGVVKLASGGVDDPSVGLNDTDTPGIWQDATVVGGIPDQYGLNDTDTPTGPSRGQKAGAIATQLLLARRFPALAQALSREIEGQNGGNLGTAAASDIIGRRNPAAAAAIRGTTTGVTPPSDAARAAQTNLYQNKTLPEIYGFQAAPFKPTEMFYGGGGGGGVSIPSVPGGGKSGPGTYSPIPPPVGGIPPGGGGFPPVPRGTPGGTTPTGPTGTSSSTIKYPVPTPPPPQERMPPRESTPPGTSTSTIRFPGLGLPPIQLPPGNGPIDTGGGTPPGDPTGVGHAGDPVYGPIVPDPGDPGGGGDEPPVVPGGPGTGGVGDYPLPPGTGGVPTLPGPDDPNPGDGGSIGGAPSYNPPIIAPPPDSGGGGGTGGGTDNPDPGFSSDVANGGWGYYNPGEPMPTPTYGNDSGSAIIQGGYAKGGIFTAPTNPAALLGPSPRKLAPIPRSPYGPTRVVTRPTLQVLGARQPQAVVPLTRRPNNRVKPEQIPSLIQKYSGARPGYGR